MTGLKELDREELLTGGTPSCAGCHAILAFRLALKVLGRNTILVNPAGCLTLSAVYPFTPYKVPWVYCAIENTAAVLTGIRMGHDAVGKDVILVGQAGDGATYDIGIQAISRAAARNEDMIYICYNNSGFGNTGFQASSATPLGSSSATSRPGAVFPEGNPLPKKDIMRIIAAHEIPYAATASTAYELDFLRKVHRAKQIKGFRFIEILTPCPTGWGFEPALGRQIGREMVRLGLWPLYEVRDGFELTVSKRPRFGAIGEHMRRQARFRHLDDQMMASIERRARADWEKLLATYNLERGGEK